MTDRYVTRQELVAALRECEVDRSSFGWLHLKAVLNSVAELIESKAPPPPVEPPQPAPAAQPSPREELTLLVAEIGEHRVLFSRRLADFRDRYFPADVPPHWSELKLGESLIYSRASNQLEYWKLGYLGSTRLSKSWPAPVGGKP